MICVFWNAHGLVAKWGSKKKLKKGALCHLIIKFFTSKLYKALVPIILSIYRM
jgi:hypothetical protein